MIILEAVIVFYITWIFYLAIMSLKREKQVLTKTVTYLAYPILFIGLLMDMIFNIFVGTIIFLEVPEQFLFTERCDSHLGENTWRGSLARWMCRNLLDPFDNGKHCRGK